MQPCPERGLSETNTSQDGRQGPQSKNDLKLKNQGRQGLYIGRVVVVSSRQVRSSLNGDIQGRRLDSSHAYNIELIHRFDHRVI